MCRENYIKLHSMTIFETTDCFDSTVVFKEDKIGDEGLPFLLTVLLYSTIVLILRQSLEGAHPIHASTPPLRERWSMEFE